MTVTQEQVAALQPGDVVALTSRLGTTLRGKLTPYGPDDEWLGFARDLPPVRTPSGRVGLTWTDDEWSLELIERAPRPLYANHERTTPVAGDVVRVEFEGGDGDDYVDVFDPVTAPGAPWLDPRTGSRYTTEQAIPSGTVRGRAVLLVDGETGQTVPA